MPMFKVKKTNIDEEIVGMETQNTHLSTYYYYFLQSYNNIYFQCTRFINRYDVRKVIEVVGGFDTTCQ